MDYFFTQTYDSYFGTSVKSWMHMWAQQLSKMINCNYCWCNFACQISFSVSIGPSYIQPKHRRSDIFVGPQWRCQFTGNVFTHYSEFIWNFAVCVVTFACIVFWVKCKDVYWGCSKGSAVCSCCRLLAMKCNAFLICTDCCMFSDWNRFSGHIWFKKSTWLDFLCM